MSSFDLSQEDAHCTGLKQVEKENQGATGQPRFHWTMAAKTTYMSPISEDLI